MNRLVAKLPVLEKVFKSRPSEGQETLMLIMTGLVMQIPWRGK